MKNHRHTPDPLSAPLRSLYEPSDADAFVSDTLGRLPRRAFHRLPIVVVFTFLWGSLAATAIVFRHALYGSLMALLHAICTLHLPSADTLLTLLVAALLVVFAVYESCQTVEDFYRND